MPALVIRAARPPYRPIRRVCLACLANVPSRRYEGAVTFGPSSTPQSQPRAQPQARTRRGPPPGPLQRCKSPPLRIPSFSAAEIRRFPDDIGKWLWRGCRRRPVASVGHARARARRHSSGRAGRCLPPAQQHGAGSRREDIGSPPSLRRPGGGSVGRLGYAAKRDVLQSRSLLHPVSRPQAADRQERLPICAGAVPLSAPGRGLSGRPSTIRRRSPSPSGGRRTSETAPASTRGPFPFLVSSGRAC